MLGGQIRVAAAGPTREELLDFVYFLERGLRRLDVDVRLGSEATRENVRGLRAYFDVADINGGPRAYASSVARRASRCRFRRWAGS